MRGYWAGILIYGQKYQDLKNLNFEPLILPLLGIQKSIGRLFPVSEHLEQQIYEEK